MSLTPTISPSFKVISPSLSKYLKDFDAEAALSLIAIVSPLLN